MEKLFHGHVLWLCNISMIWLHLVFGFFKCKIISLDMANSNPMTKLLYEIIKGKVT